MCCEVFGKEEVSRAGIIWQSGSLLILRIISKCRALIAGGGAPEIHVSRLLTQYGQTLRGKEAYCFQAFAEALEVIPTTLAENAGLNPIAIVTELRNRHALGEKNAGINVRKVRIGSVRQSKQKVAALLTQVCVR